MNWLINDSAEQVDQINHFEKQVDTISYYENWLTLETIQKAIEAAIQR